MVDAVRRTDTVGRMGGDEFMVILSEISSSRDVERVGLNIIENLSRPYDLGNDRAVIGACIGAAVYPSDAEDVEKLISLADAAMYECKAAGKNQFRAASDINPKT